MPQAGAGQEAGPPPAPPRPAGTAPANAAAAVGAAPQVSSCRPNGALPSLADTIIPPRGAALPDPGAAARSWCCPVLVLSSPGMAAWFWFCPVLVLLPGPCTAAWF